MKPCARFRHGDVPVDCPEKYTGDCNLRAPRERQVHGAGGDNHRARRGRQEEGGRGREGAEAEGCWPEDAGREEVAEVKEVEGGQGEDICKAARIVRPRP